MERQLKTIVIILTVAMFIMITAFLPANLNAGSLEPSGPPGPTMKTLDEIPPTWSQKITDSAARFELVLDGAGVLDKETGLVWEQSPRSETISNWYDACYHCYDREVGGRKGWRLPTIEELASLVDNSVAGSPKLPSGYENFFNNVQPFYWSSTTHAFFISNAWGVYLYNGNVGDGGIKSSSGNGYVWCVRGGHGHDAY